MEHKPRTPTINRQLAIAGLWTAGLVFSVVAVKANFDRRDEKAGIVDITLTDGQRTNTVKINDVTDYFNLMSSAQRQHMTMSEATLVVNGDTIKVKPTAPAPGLGVSK